MDYLQNFGAAPLGNCLHERQWSWLVRITDGWIGLRTHTHTHI